MQKLIIALFMVLGLTNVAQAKNTYPTDEVVRYVIGCMAELGGQREENLYTCVCRIDYISERMTYEEYDGGNIMERYKKMPGKKGGFFRDNELGEEMYEKLVKTREGAFAQCPAVKRIEVKRDEPSDS